MTTKTYDDTNRGVLWTNARKTHPRAPDYTGRINVNGITYRLAAWTRAGKNGSFLALMVSADNNAPPPKDADDAPF